MDRHPLYEEDFHAWTEAQATALRRLAATLQPAPNDLDLVAVAEEIESVGWSERAAAESHLRQVFVHLIKIASSPLAPAVKHWGKEIVGFHNEFLGRFTPSMAQRIDCDLVWARAVREAAAALEADGEALRPGLPTACPFAIVDIAVETFSVADGLARIAMATDGGAPDA
ncbi:DUF29 domain-containing protein [Chthonobacter rhizosphaerae]|uniref:DUF29 domain-containing protein n=1 Tax=Chthonobacter rhizosphaerae TaxID=2735553 RepID=UPI0015EFB34C|nr:DUF29 domain-containing protein [Chthonobacter rhizosphaerae]